MAESQLQSAGAGDEPQGLTQVADDLIWSVQLRLIRKQRSKLVKLVPTLLVKLRQGLQLIEYPQERIPVLFDHLITLHEQAFEGVSQAIAAEHGGAGGADLDQDSAFDAVASSMVWVGEDATSELGYVGAGIDAETSARAGVLGLPAGLWFVADLNVGSWVELMLQGTWVRAQLTWASPHLTLFMFVSGKGLAHSMSRRTIDQRRAQGLIRVVSDGDVVGSALDEVAQAALRNEPARTLSDSVPEPPV